MLPIRQSCCICSACFLQVAASVWGSGPYTLQTSLRLDGVTVCYVVKVGAAVFCGTSC